MLETSRLLIRDFRPEDWVAVHEYGNDPEVYRFQSWGPSTEQDSRAFVDMAIAQQTEKPRRSFEMAIVEKSSQLVIGAVGLRIKSTVNRDADIGYTLRHDRWGKGYGTEAARAILDFGIKTLGMHRIWATTAPENQTSARILEKLGMQKEGHLKQNLMVRGKWRDSLLYAVVLD
jgi:ribosomal-protein-alanine N-acetyltransferase